MGYQAVDLISIGLDLGQRVDPTAVAAARVIERPTGGSLGSGAYAQAETLAFYDVRVLERLPLDTPYAKVAEVIAQLVRDLQQLPPLMDDNVPMVRIPRELVLTVDQTGGGIPAYEMIERAVEGLRVRLVPVTFVHGEGKPRWRGSAYAVGKGYMVSRLSALFEQGRIGLLKHHPDEAAIRREIKDFERRVSQDGVDKYEGQRGTHDDLVSALGLCCLDEPSAHQVTLGPPVW